MTVRRLHASKGVNILRATGYLVLVTKKLLVLHSTDMKHSFIFSFYPLAKFEFYQCTFLDSKMTKMTH